MKVILYLINFKIKTNDLGLPDIGSESFEQLMPENKAPSVKLQQFEEITQHFKAIYSGIAPMLMNLFKIAIIQAKFLKEHRSFKQFIRSLMIYLIEVGHKLDKFSQNYCSLINSAVVEWPQPTSFDLFEAYSTVRGWADEAKII